MKLAVVVSITVATLTVAASYATAGFWLPVALIVGLGLLWSLSTWPVWPWFNVIGLIGLVGGAASGISLGLSPDWLLGGTVATLVAWDAYNLLIRLAQTAQSATDTWLLRSHFGRLAIACGLGILLGGLALRLETRLTFGLAVLLGLLLAVSLSWTFGTIKGSREK
jgi:hypothetical protein